MDKKTSGIGSHFYSIKSNFLAGGRQWRIIDDHLGSFGQIKSDVPQSSVLGPILFNPYTTNMWTENESHIVAYADETFLFIPISYIHDLSSAAEILINDVFKIL